MAPRGRPGPYSCSLHRLGPRQSAAGGSWTGSGGFRLKEQGENAQWAWRVVMRAGLPGSHDEVTTDRGQRRGQDWAPMPPPPPHLSPPGLRALLWGGTTEGARESAPQEKGEGVPERDPSHGRAEDQGLRPQGRTRPVAARSLPRAMHRGRRRAHGISGASE